MRMPQASFIPILTATGMDTNKNVSSRAVEGLRRASESACCAQAESRDQSAPLGRGESGAIRFGSTWPLRPSIRRKRSR
jgi:hypothetical protein